MSTLSNREHFEVLWPGGPSAIAQIQPAPRLSALAGKRIGFLWDDMFRGDDIFPILEEHLRALEPSAEIVGYETFGSIFGGDEHTVLEALPDRLKRLEIDAVVSGNGC